MNITLPTIVIKQNKQKENSATHSKQNLESADSCKPLLLLVERIYVSLSHALPAHSHRDIRRSRGCFSHVLLHPPRPFHQINKTVKFFTSLPHLFLL